MKKLALLAASSLALALLPARPAEACGGLFCASSNSVPVDQTAERILFEVNDDGTVTATVEVSYTGAAADFSWIVPVPEVPTQLGVASPSLLLLLDTATTPVILPPPTTCDGDFAVGGSAGEGEGEAAPREDGGVDVVELPNVGPYGDIVVVSSEDSEALVTWLNDNGYLVTEAMRPFIDEYVAEGQKFLALRLQPTAGTEDIVPVRFTCPAAGPHIPLRLTAIASAPELAVVAFIAGAGRYQPSNYRSLVVDESQLRFDARNFRFNYYPLVSWMIDEAGGRAFVTQRAGAAAGVAPLVEQTFLGTTDEEDARAELLSLLERRPYFTRLYARMNAEEMDEDPLFLLSDGGDVSGTFDLSDAEPIDVCAEEPPPPCGSTYCGQDAACAATEEGLEGCVCAEGQTARRMQGPFGESVFCISSSMDLLEGVFTGASDPCAFFSCGEGGQCITVNGAPTCACETGFAAVVDFEIPQGVQCRPVQEAYPPERLTGDVVEPIDPSVISDGPGAFRRERPGAFCACVEARAASGIWGALCALGLFGLLGAARPRAAAPRTKRR